MRRHSTDLWVVFLLSVAPGVIALLWAALDLGRGCGYAARLGLPSFPVTTAFAVLAGSSAVITGALTGIAGRSPRVIAALTAPAAILAAVVPTTVDRHGLRKGTRVQRYRWSARRHWTLSRDSRSSPSLGSATDPPIHHNDAGKRNFGNRQIRALSRKRGRVRLKMKPSSRRLIVVLVCGLAVVVGVLLALRGGDGLSPGQLPPRFGVVLAVAAFLSGAFIGLRGYVPVYVGIVAYALTLLLRTPPSPPGGDSKLGALLLFLTLIPAYYVAPTALGAVFRRLVIALLRRL